MALSFRIFTYVNLRLISIEEVKSLESWETIKPQNLYFMGIEEFIMNLVLLCYFYGVNTQIGGTRKSSMKRTSIKVEDEEFDKEMEGILTRATILRKSNFRKTFTEDDETY